MATLHRPPPAPRGLNLGQLNRWRTWERRLDDHLRHGDISQAEMRTLLEQRPIAGGAVLSTPATTDTGSAVISLQTLALGSLLTGTIDLRTKWGGYVYCAVGRGGTTALTTGITWYIRPKINNGATAQPSGPTFIGDTTAATSRPTMAASGNNAASTSFVTVSTGFAVGDSVFIDDTGNVGLAASEWVVPQKITATVTHLIDKSGGLEFAHNSTSAHASNHADVYPGVWMYGGAVWEVVCSYGASTTGDTAAVRGLYETFDSISTA